MDPDDLKAIGIVMNAERHLFFIVILTTIRV